MNLIYIIKSKDTSKELDKMLSVFTSTTKCVFIDDILNPPDLTNTKILFALELDDIGYCSEVFAVISILTKRGPTSLKDSTGAVLIHSKSELFTKSAANNLVFLANELGCSFIGHPLIEATASLNNFLTWQKTMDMPLGEICIQQCIKLHNRLLNDHIIKFETPKILALHASHKNTSNTLKLWNMIKQNVSGCDIEELNVENGTIHDCIGCTFKTCIHYSKQNSCFYGGFMISEIVPAIEKADVVVLVCPNYNDAISANLTAVINRTTALYRKMSFNEKYLFSVVVSGNSGSDSVAKQLIGSLNINKGFRLPSYSTIMATANDPGAINRVTNIDKKAKFFAKNMLLQIKK
jgi:multimeric flavodoxin WrbA